MTEFFALFAITWQEALAVVVSAIIIYVVFLLFVRLFGARVLAQISTFDALIVIMLGAVAGRAILMDVPWLPAGILALFTLFTLEVVFGELRSRALGNRILNQSPIAVVVKGEIVDAALVTVHLSRDELASSLRLAGVRRLDEVELAVFEPHGRLSVLRAGVEPDAEVLRSVVFPASMPRD